MKIAIIIPTLNGERTFTMVAKSLREQSISAESQTMVIDSESSDSTSVIAKEYGWRVVDIDRKSFNHGGTRQKGVELCDAEIIIFLTQDVILANERSIEKLVACFDNPKVSAAYGCQLPHKNAGALAAHARLCNYPSESRLKSLKDAPELGIKTAFISNSFAAYRREALMTVGGFPSNTILGEDTYVAAKMLLAGWKVQYCAESKVYHSHDYSLIQEFKRYFDIGVFHAREEWIRESFGKAEGEGLKFVLSEAKYLINTGKAYLLPVALIRTGLKYLGYRLGIKEQYLPVSIKKQFSMHSNYWN